jgi:hypothetical protein
MGEVGVVARKLRIVSWICTFSPLVFPVLFMILGICGRMELGHWLEYGERFTPSPAFALRQEIAGWVMLVTVVGALPLWLGCVVIGWRRAAMSKVFRVQALAYAGVWVVAVIAILVDPTGYGEWHLD